MNKNDLSKYPRNILIPVVLLIIGMLIVFVIYKINQPQEDISSNIKPQVKFSMNTKADFIVEASVLVGEGEQTKDSIPISGNTKLDIDLANGEIILKELLLASKPVHLNNFELDIKNLKVTLNSSYPSVGRVTLDNGTIDISLDLLISYDYKSKESHSYTRNLNMTIPLSGHIDKDSGVIKLTGEATIPPDKHSIPLPITIQVVATTKENAVKTNR